MDNVIRLNYKQRPSGIISVLLAALGYSKHFDRNHPTPKISAKLENIKIYIKHLNRFNELCKIEPSEKISIIYPFTHVYPLLQRIIAQKSAPLSMFRALNSQIQVNQHRWIEKTETLDIFCELIALRVLERGLEIDISSVVSSEGEPVWENIQTFFYRGGFGIPDRKSIRPQFDIIKDNDKKVAGWFLPEGNGLAFAKISGDGNGIHYSKRYARLFGFKRDFAQPLLVLGKSMEHLIDKNGGKRVHLDMLLKGQFYYENDIAIRSCHIKETERFDIYCEGNPLPCVMGKLNLL